MEQFGFVKKIAIQFAMEAVGYLEKTSYPFTQYTKVAAMKTGLSLEDPYVLHRVFFNQKDPNAEGEIVCDVCLTNNVVDGEWTGGYLIATIPGDFHRYRAYITSIDADEREGKGRLNVLKWEWQRAYSFDAGKEGAPGFPTPIKILKFSARNGKDRIHIPLA